MSPGDLKYSVYNLLPTPIRVQGRSFFRNYLLDFADRLGGKADPGIPPRHLNISGDGPFRLYGRNTVELCRRYAGLNVHDAVLDIGCGIGRTALALTEFLKEPGRYAGFDIIRFAVAWCQEHIALEHPNFSFLHADVKNRTYNPSGGSRPEHYTFPYQNGEFSFALATSLFTHLMPGAAQHYIAEISRVLRPGSSVLTTWFLLDEQTNSVIASNQFPHRFEHHCQATLQAPEQAVAFDRNYVERVFKANQFELTGRYRGDWSRPADPIESMQDIIVARRI